MKGAVRMKRETIVPARLPAGGVIGVCSPSHIATREGYAPTLANLRAMGYRVKEAPHLYSASYGYQASPEERAEDFMSLILDDEVNMLLFGGGECSNELLPLLDFEAIRRHPKLICSYSDATTLLCAVWALSGVETYYGQSVRTFAAPEDYELAQFRRHQVEGGVTRHQPSAPWRALTPGHAEGTLVGGYTRNFALLQGTRYFPYDPAERHLLFLEDHRMFGGVDYVSAMLTAIEQSDFMQTVTGMIFGHYSEPTDSFLLERLTRLGRRWNIPVAYCDDFGHGARQAILPIGRRAALDVSDDAVLTFPAKRGVTADA